MANPNVFTFKFGEGDNAQTLYADPLKIRRVLLEHTMGKCWSVVKRIRQAQSEIVEARDKGDQLRADLITTPTTEDEMKVLAEIQKAHQAGTQPTIPFDQLPRVYKADLYDGKVAALAVQVSQLEGSLAVAAYEAFDLPPFKVEDGSGVTEQEALDVLKQYLEYAEGKGERLGS